MSSLHGGVVEGAYCNVATLQHATLLPPAYQPNTPLYQPNTPLYQPNTRLYHAKPHLYHAKPHLYQRVSCPPNYTKGGSQTKV